MKKKMSKVFVIGAIVVAVMAVLGYVKNKILETEYERYDEDEDYDCSCHQEDEYERRCNEVCSWRQRN